MYLGELPHFILKHHFAVIIVFDFTWYHFVLNNIEGVMIPSCAPYTSIQMEYVVHKPWGASSYYLEHWFDLILS
jgi:hypothetical protein